MAELLALSVMVQFAREGERGTPATSTSKLAAIKRAVDTFLTDTDAPDKSQKEALTDVVCAARPTAQKPCSPTTRINQLQNTEGAREPTRS